jgi:hypothetical protein
MFPKAYLPDSLRATTIIIILLIGNIQQYNRNQHLEEQVSYVIKKSRERNGLPL